MPVRIEDDIAELEAAGELRFARLLTLVGRHFQTTKKGGRGSHHVFKTPWKGDPRINLQPTKDGKAKRYQVQQVVNALRKLQGQMIAGDD